MKPRVQFDMCKGMDEDYAAEQENLAPKEALPALGED